MKNINNGIIEDNEKLKIKQNDDLQKKNPK